MFTADPTAVEYQGRLYVYGTNDTEQYEQTEKNSYEKIKTMEGIHIIGYVTEKGMPCVMVTPQNTTIELKAQGFTAQ